MADQLVIERFEFQGHCGVTEAERLVPQPLAVDLVVEYPEKAVAAIADSDDLAGAVDYTRIVQRLHEIGVQFARSLSAEYARAAALGLGPGQLRRVAVQAARASLLPPAARKGLERSVAAGWPAGRPRAERSSGPA